MDFADQLGWKNIMQVRAGVTEKAPKAIRLTETYESFWRASTRDGMYASSGALAVASTNPKDGKFIGQEIDLLAGRTWRKAIELGIGYCHLFTGTFLDRTTQGRGYNYPFAYLEFHFTNVEEH